jgi:hypothetical protein
MVQNHRRRSVIQQFQRNRAGDGHRTIGQMH